MLFNNIVTHNKNLTMWTGPFLFIFLLKCFSIYCINAGFKPLYYEAASWTFNYGINKHANHYYTMGVTPLEGK
jgi:hypothetical protein